jgi:glutamate 5-kinase
MPTTQFRQDVLRSAKRVLIKLGTQLLTGSDGHLDLAYFNRIASQVAELRTRGVEVTLVSSGAIGAGCAELGRADRPQDLADQQAVAAVGQRRLMTHYHDAFEKLGLHVGQLLLTRDDFDNRIRFLNIRNCIARLHETNCIPIINENDTVAVDELRFGENDLLAALTCSALRADVLVLLTVVDGLLDEDGRRIDMIVDLNEAKNLAHAETSELGSGGMLSKLEAARRVTEAGEPAVIAHGRIPNVLSRLFAGEPGIGTVVLPANRKLGSRQRWIALTKRRTGTVTIDQGAARALLQRGKSLLAIGVTAIEGRFDKGAVLEVRDPDGRAIARGLSNYSVLELTAIMGKRSNQFEKTLGRPAYAEVIHRDNMVLIDR